MHLNQVDWSLSGYAPCSFSMEACPSPPGTETSPSPATSRRSSPELHWKDQIYLLLLCREDSQSSFRNHFSLMASRYGRTVQSRVQSPSLPADHRPPVAASPSWLLFVIKTCLPPTPTIKGKNSFFFSCCDSPRSLESQFHFLCVPIPSQEQKHKVSPKGKITFFWVITCIYIPRV